MPGLFLDLALGRVPVLVQRLKIAKDTSNFFASDTQLLGIHEFPPWRLVEAGLGQEGSQNNNDQQTFSSFQSFNPEERI